MFAGLKRRLRRFLAAPSGTRFQAHYERMQARASLTRTLIGIGAGLILLVLPGPGMLVAIIGAGLIAGESLTVAKILDWLDVRVRALWKRWRG